MVTENVIIWYMCSNRQSSKSMLTNNLMFSILCNCHHSVIVISHKIDHININITSIVCIYISLTKQINKDAINCFTCKQSPLQAELISWVSLDNVPTRFQHRVLSAPWTPCWRIMSCRAEIFCRIILWNYLFVKMKCCFILSKCLVLKNTGYRNQDK